MMDWSLFQKQEMRSEGKGYDRREWRHRGWNDHVFTPNDVVPWEMWKLPEEMPDA